MKPENKANLAAALARKSYCSYVIMAHDGKWVAGKLHRYICNKVQDFVTRPTEKPYEILILSVPPQHGKSQAITETLPSWYLGKFPDKRVIEISYNDEFAVKFGRKNRTKIERFGCVFGMRLDKATDREFAIKDHFGSMISRGVMSGITGNSGDLIIIDDPIKNRQEADSETYRKRLQEEWQDSIKTRTQAGTKIILIQTRWHEDDLTGYLLKTEEDVQYINIPCEAEENDVLGRQLGEALAPEIGKGDEWLKKFKKGYTSQEGSRSWNALFQGRPTAQEGNMIKRSWWQWYKSLPQCPVKIMSVDATFKDGKKNDFVSIQIWGKRNADMYLMDRTKAKMDFPTTLQAIRTMKNKHKGLRAIYIEDKANGSAIIQVLRKEIGGVIGVTPKESKEARAAAVSPQIEAGNVYLPEEEEWVHDFVEEFSAFPLGAHDDDVDSATQAINILRHTDATVSEKEPSAYEQKRQKLISDLGGKMPSKLF